MSVLDVPTGTMFLTQINKDAIICWNTNRRLLPENIALVAQDNNALVFTNDLQVNDILIVKTEPILIVVFINFERHNMEICVLSEILVVDIPKIYYPRNRIIREQKSH